MVVILSIIGTLGTAYKVLERSYEGDTSSVLDFSLSTNSFWLIIITMTTVGYGDGYPSTHLGRFIASMACLLGMFLISLIVVALINLTGFSQ